MLLSPLLFSLLSQHVLLLFFLVSLLLLAALVVPHRVLFGLARHRHPDVVRLLVLLGRCERAARARATVLRLRRRAAARDRDVPARDRPVCACRTSLLVGLHRDLDDADELLDLLDGALLCCHLRLIVVPRQLPLRHVVASIVRLLAVRRCRRECRTLGPLLRQRV